MTVTIPNLGKITADKDTLNNLASLLIDVTDYYEEKENKEHKDYITTMIKISKRQFNTVFNALDNVGYFDK